MEDVELYIYGAGGHAKVIAAMAEDHKLSIAGVFDKKLLQTYLLKKYPVYLEIESVELENKNKFIVAIGNNLLRKRIVNQELKEKSFAIIKDKTAIVSKYATVEEGTVLMPGATVNVDVQIGSHCIINTNASIDHDCVLEDYVHISPNASLAGNVFVGEGTHVGIGAVVIQGVKIGKWCTIGAGTVIIKNVPDGCVVVGNPGKIIRIEKI